MPYVIQHRVKQKLSKRVRAQRRKRKGSTPGDPLCFHGPTAKQVRNLAWLLAHHDEVDGFEVISWPEEDGAMDADDPRAMMVAHLVGGDIYVCLWASMKVMENWLDRPKFRGLPLTVNGTEDNC
jgi:hypothetical protein